MIIKLFKKNNNIDIDKINDIKNYLRENAFIIKINANNKDSFELNEELIENFKSIYNLIDNDENINKNDIYYDTLKYIFFKEVKKISEVNYHYIILENLLKNEVIIKKSNDIFQIIFKNYFKQEKFKNIIENIFKGEEVTLKLLEKKLNGENAINLGEMLLYFIKKNSLKYFQNVLNQKEIINLDDEPLKIFLEAIKFLDIYLTKPEKCSSFLKELFKLFCLSYMKAFCYMFIKMFDDDQPKLKDPKKIIEIINGKNSIYKIIRLYIYKVLYNYYKIDFFDNEEIIKQYMLNEYIDYKEFIKIKGLENLYRIDYKVKTLKNEYLEKSYNVFENYKKDGYNNK